MKRLFAIILTILMFFSLLGCQNNQTPLKRFNPNHPTTNKDTFVAAENDEWQLIWQREKYRIILKNKVTGSEWTNVPSELLETRYDEDGYEIDNHPQLENPMIVEYVDTEKMVVKTVFAYTSCFQKGAFSIDKIKNGIKITYFFDQQSFSVPIEYKLLSDGLNVSVDPDEISEADVPIYRISLSPFFCSAGNASDDGYLFVPSGSGALIYPNKWESDVGYTFSYPVYGGDEQLKNSNGNNITNNENIRLPVYGSKYGNNAVCAIIDSGAESASIEGNIGNLRFGYSSVYTTFTMRGKSTTGNYSDIMPAHKMSVSFYPLTGDKANYMGMAEKFRQWVEEKYALEKGGDETALSVELLGGTHTDEQFIGIPYKKFTAVTTINEALGIIKDIYNNTGVKAAVVLKGYGKSGLDTGTVSGGGKISSKLGSKRDIKQLNEFCSNNDIDLYLDFDITHFSKSGNGVSKKFDSAITNIGQRAMRYKRNFGVENEVILKEYFVARQKLLEVAENTADSLLDFEISGISYSTMSNTVYSDYSDKKYYSNGTFGEDYIQVADALKNKKLNVLADRANLYAVPSATIIINAPVQSDRNDLFSADIPFYQIVFKGIKPMTSTSINLAIEQNEIILRSAESGCGLNYTLSQNYTTDFITAQQPYLHATVYNGLSESVKNNVASYESYFESIKGAMITNHTIINEYVRKTEFDNGVVVFVNYGNEDFISENATVKAKDYFYTMEG